MSNGREVLNELSVEIEESEESPKFLSGMWDWPFEYASDLSLVHADRIVTNNQTEVLSLQLLEFALGMLKVELVVSKQLKYFPYDLSVFLKGGGIDHDVIYVDDDLSSINEIVE